MDRDNRWDRIKKSYDLMVKGRGKKTTNLKKSIQESYDSGVTDEFIKPIVCVDNTNNPIAIPVIINDAVNAMMIFEIKY